jgi:hypothetical protein
MGVFVVYRVVLDVRTGRGSDKNKGAISPVRTRTETRLGIDERHRDTAVSNSGNRLNIITNEDDEHTIGIAPMVTECGSEPPEPAVAPPCTSNLTPPSD